MGRYKGMRVRLWPLLLCIALACAFAPALAFAGVQDVPDLTLQASGASNKADVETDEIGVLPAEPKVGSKHKVGGATYKVTNSEKKTVALVKPKSVANVKVPNTVRIKGKTYRVTAISANAFKSVRNKVRTVTIGANVTTIGKGAFSQCAKLTTVTIGKNVTKIGVNAFSQCAKLATVKGGAKVGTIGKGAFSQCAKLVAFTVGKNVATIGTGAFSQCTKLATVKGGAKVKTIGAKAFSGCKNMETCTPFSSKSLVKVGKQAVSGAKKLTALTVKSKQLKGDSVKGSLSGSSVKTVKVKVGSKKLNQKYVQKYKKVFAKKYSGKDVTVK